MSTATVILAACPTWCEATHDQDRNLHLQEPVTLRDLDGRPFEVSAFSDSRTGRHGLYLGGYEISPETARLIALELTDGADLAEQAAKQAIR
jgi:hypothetical protein